MRISDWSSDVCSSDLPVAAAGQTGRRDRGTGLLSGALVASPPDACHGNAAFCGVLEDGFKLARPPGPGCSASDENCRCSYTCRAAGRRECVLRDAAFGGSSACGFFLRAIEE